MWKGGKCTNRDNHNEMLDEELQKTGSWALFRSNQALQQTDQFLMWIVLLGCKNAEKLAAAMCQKVRTESTVVMLWWPIS